MTNLGINRDGYDGIITSWLNTNPNLGREAIADMLIVRYKTLSRTDVLVIALRFFNRRTSAGSREH